MKRHLLIYALTAVAALGLSSCGDDDLNSESIIIADKVASNTPFDKWLVEKIQTPYNLYIDWRWNENEVSLGNYTIPADYESAIKLAHVLKYCCLEAYDEVVSIDFTRRNFPKQIVFVGSWQYNNNNSRTLGTAEGGRKIWLLGVNDISLNVNSIAKLNSEYLKTIHHEFTHILNQTVPYSVAYKELTKTTYIADSWSVAPNNTGYRQRGYITAYAQHSPGEDIAEMYSMYVTHTPAEWQAYLDEAVITNTDDAGNVTYDYTYQAILEKKLDMVRDYMMKSWKIDMDKVRDVLHRRTNDIVSGKIDLTDLTVNEN